MAHPIGQPSRNDPGRRPGWEQRAVEGISKAQRSLVSFHTTDDFRRMVRRAAVSRNMSISSYIRRSVAAFIALDLDVPFEDVCALNFRVTGPNEKSRRNLSPDDGEGYGQWRIEEIV